ncbi:MAG: hypothetical protein FWE67_09215 [Planctomycetaceae bacterium]|nr:hypothetical protein [Planctomycetaceae bacterium]
MSETKKIVWLLKQTQVSSQYEFTTIGVFDNAEAAGLACHHLNLRYFFLDDYEYCYTEEDGAFFRYTGTERYGDDVSIDAEQYDISYDEHSHFYTVEWKRVLSDVPDCWLSDDEDSVE